MNDTEKRAAEGISESGDQKEEVAGSCFIVGSPIDEREDITQRAVRALQAADIVVTGDEKHAASLLKRYAISKQLLGIGPEIEGDVTTAVSERLDRGERVVLLSAPSFRIFPALGRLIASVREKGLEPRVIPGVDVATTAIVMSGFPSTRYYVGGRLPGRTSSLADEARRLSGIPITTVLQGGSSRIRTTLQVFGDIMGTRPAAIVLRPTVPGEVIRRGPVNELAHFFGEREFDGEWVLILGPDERSSEEFEEERNRDRDRRPERGPRDDRRPDRRGDRRPDRRDERRNGPPNRDRRYGKR